MTSLKGVRKRRLTAKQTSIIRRKILHREIAVQGIFVGIIIKAGGASLKVTDLLFASLFVKNKPGILMSSLVGCLLFVNFD